jgi:hypothetical protein
MYVVKFGVLDGRPGWHLAMLMASYEYMIGLLYDEKLERLREGTLELPGLSNEQIRAMSSGGAVQRSAA